MHLLNAWQTITLVRLPNIFRTMKKMEDTSKQNAKIKMYKGFSLWHIKCEEEHICKFLGLSWWLSILQNLSQWIQDEVQSKFFGY